MHISAWPIEALISNLEMVRQTTRCYSRLEHFTAVMVVHEMNRVVGYYGSRADGNHPLVSAAVHMDRPAARPCALSAAGTACDRRELDRQGNRHRSDQAFAPTLRHGRGPDRRPRADRQRGRCRICCVLEAARIRCLKRTIRSFSSGRSPTLRHRFGRHSSQAIPSVGDSAPQSRNQHP